MSASPKLADAYCYLKLKMLVDFDKHVLHLLWAADCISLERIWRTIFLEALPITKMPVIETFECSTCGATHPKGYNSTYGPFENLSRFDVLTLDEVVLDHVNGNLKDIKEFSSLEEFFGPDNIDIIAEAREYMERLRANEKLLEEYGI
jgi:hypothetical protein